MSQLPRVVEVGYLGGRALRLGFSDGTVRELDFAGTLHGVLSELDDDGVFPAAEVDPVSGTVCWPIGIDLDPDVLRGESAANPVHQPRLLREYRLLSN